MMFKWLCAILTVIFVIARLIGVVSWSWWQVFTPVIMYVAFYIIAIVLFIILDLKK